MSILLRLLLLGVGGIVGLVLVCLYFLAAYSIVDKNEKHWWIYTLAALGAGVIGLVAYTKLIPAPDVWWAIVIAVLSVLAIYFSYLIFWFRFGVARGILTAVNVIIVGLLIVNHLIVPFMAFLPEELTALGTKGLMSILGAFSFVISIAPWITWVIENRNPPSPGPPKDPTKPTCRDCYYYWKDIDLPHPVCKLHKFHFEHDFDPCNKFTRK